MEGPGDVDGVGPPLGLALDGSVGLVTVGLGDERGGGRLTCDCRRESLGLPRMGARRCRRPRVLFGDPLGQVLGWAVAEGATKEAMSRLTLGVPLLHWRHERREEAG